MYTFQTRTITKRSTLNDFQSFRQRHACQTCTITEREFFDSLYTCRYEYTCESTTSTIRIRTYSCHRIRNHCTAQACCTGKRRKSNGFQTIRQINIAYTRCATECVLIDCFKCTWQFYSIDIRCIIERICRNCCYTFRDYHIGQLFATHERRIVGVTHSRVIGSFCCPFLRIIHITQLCTVSERFTI